MAAMDVAALPVAEQVRMWDEAIKADPKLGLIPEVAEGLRQLQEVLADNPLQAFEVHECRECGRRERDNPACREHRVPQREFFEADTMVVAAFAGNRFGKTTSLVVRAIRECVDRDCLPEFLADTKLFDAPVAGWVICPTEEKVFDTLIPAFQKWVPKHQLKGGVWDKAWNGSRFILTFANGSTISFKTYKQDPSTLGGAALHFVGYDEPPPREHRDECMTRLYDHGGYEMFAMTPLKTNTGWIRRDIYKRREAAHITVIRGSMHDNPTLDQKTKSVRLAEYASDLWAKAREFGDFVDIGGMIYNDFEKRVTSQPPDGDLVRLLDPAVGIDPGIRNAAFIFGGFDNDNTLGVYDELLIQDGTVDDWVTGIKAVLSRWGIPFSRVDFIIDPAARARGGPSAENVENALADRGVYCVHGQNAVENGIQQIRSRIQHSRIWVSPACRGLRDEADEYAAEDRGDGEFKPVKQNDHRMDALRYLAMHRPYLHVAETAETRRSLGWNPNDNRAPAAKYLTQTQLEGAPMGSMS